QSITVSCSTKRMDMRAILRPAVVKLPDRRFQDRTRHGRRVRSVHGCIHSDPGRADPEAAKVRSVKIRRSFFHRPAMSVVTRFAPSPTGYLHIGGARTALFSYLYAKRHAGKYLLRIEDTDLERSTQAAVQAIFEGLDWLGLPSDVEPVFQTQRFDRYREVIEQMLAAGTAYHCYASKEELDKMRAEQMARKEKPRYDGRWRPEPGKTLPPRP